MLATLTLMVRDEEGAMLVEYGLLLGLIALVALTAVQLFGRNVAMLFAPSSARYSAGLGPL